MSYEVIWSKDSINSLEKLEPFISKRIIKYVKSFAQNPRKREFKKLKGNSSFRIRAGDYRIFFEFDKENKRINVLEIGHRKNIYKKK